MSTGGENEAILNSKHLPLSKFNRCTSTVCLLALSNGVSITRKASGFLAKFKLNDQLKIFVIMSNHFVATPEEASRVEATFGFEGNSPIVTVQLNADIFFRTNQELDYTFVGISEEDVAKLRNELEVIPVKLGKETLEVKVDDIIHIPQHLEGKQKRISYSKVCGVTDTEVFYEADTSHGSSGSPVLYSQNNDMHVLALHKSGGVTLYNGKEANKGILMSAILNHLRSHSENDKRPADVFEGASSNGTSESGAFVDGTKTNQGFPVVQTQSEENVPGTKSDAPSSCLVQETGSPSSKTSHSQQSKSPAPFVQPSPSFVQASPQGPSPIRQVEPVCQYPFECKELIRIAKRIAGKWPMVAKHTGYFKEYEISNILYDNTLGTPVMKADRMLNDFKSRLGERRDLANAIHESDEFELAKNVRSGFYINNCD